MIVTKGEKIVLINPFGEMQRLGEVYEVANIIEDNGTKIVIRDTKKRMAVCCIDINDFEKYFDNYSNIRKWTRWTRLVNGRGDIIGFTRSNNKKVQVKSLDGVKATASCNLAEDNFNLEFGVQLAALRCRQKVLTNQLKYHLKESRKVNDYIIETESSINKLVKSLGG